MQDIQTVKITDEHYPKFLKKISDPPKVLYYRGTLPKHDEISIAIVGTRRPTPYGQQVTLQMAGELADANIAVISGMAPGIDTFAHKACVEKNKRTIAVLGTGLDEKSIYPHDNVPLSRKIIECGGCLISELAPGTHGSKITFPKRNRIVSALSSGVVVIEAKEKSGSLITANYAKNHKKPLFATPGPIFSQNSKGPNVLIKEGAQLIESAKDVLDVLGIEPIKNTTRATGENPQENAILDVLRQDQLTVDAIIQKTKLQASLVSTTLALMEISGKIRNLGGNTYSLN